MTKREILPEVERAFEKRGGHLTGRMAPVMVKELDAIDTFWTDCDHALMAQYCEADPRFVRLYKLMIDPAQSGKRFSWLCQKVGVGLKDVCDLYMDSQRRRGMMRLAGALPEVMGDVGEDAKSTKRPCRACDGTGKIDDKDPCPDCEATGIIRIKGDAHARDLMFETFKFTGNSKGVSVNFNTQNNFNDRSSERLEDLFKMTRAIAITAESVVEAEKVNE